MLSLSITATAIGPYRAVVAADGSGDYMTVSEAIAAAPEGLTHPWPILIKSGDYDELIEIPETKPYIYLIGQDRENTIIHHLINQGGRPEEFTRYDKTVYWESSKNNPESPTFEKGPAAVMIKAPDFYAESISFVNDWGTQSTSGPQALAMHSNADRVALNDCRLRSFQDTWRTPSDETSRNYARNCLIEGAVDYMYDGGDVFVEHSTFYNVRAGSVIVAPNHGPNVKYGYVLSDCAIDGNTQSGDGRTKLGRPWKQAPRAVWLNTLVLIPIDPAGWGDMGAVPAVFADYNSRDRYGNPLDLSARKTRYSVRDRKTGETREAESKATLTPEEAAAYTYEAVIRPDEGWDPRSMTTPLPAPAGLTYSGGLLSWQPVDGASGYIVYDGDSIIAVTETTEMAVPRVGNSLKVRAVNKYGVKGLPAQ